MKISEAEHLFRAIREVTRKDNILVVGSNAIIGAFLDEKGDFEFWQSKEMDIVIKDTEPEIADLVQGVFGEGGLFERAFGIMADVVSEKTSVMPEGWQRRLIKRRMPNGLLLRFISPEDLAFAKYVAWRGKDEEFLEKLWQEGLIDIEKMRRLHPLLPEDLPEEIKEIVQARFERHYRQFCEARNVPAP